ncbi:carbamoyl-phosphate synthase small chain [Clostridia bacterium]|nr:carbamoyl-phosphate synthase small chain [Clostridia bacterium]
MKAFLVLEDGTVFVGAGIGTPKEVVSEIVFNTSMTGYLEVLTDPSYAGQAVVMTYPLIGNYGITPDMESKQPWPDAFIVRELSRTHSNFRSEGSIQDFLLGYKIPGIAGIDTRALTKILREKGTMNGLIAFEGNGESGRLYGRRQTDRVEKLSETDPALQTLTAAPIGTITKLSENENTAAVLERIAAYSVTGVVKKTTCAEKELHSVLGEANNRLQDYGTFPMEKPVFSSNPKRVALLDLGAKANITQSLQERNCEVTIYPAITKAEEILADRPDGIMLSNGPGDPSECSDIIAEIRKLYKSDIPIFAICLGHQLMALATGATTHKMKYGHRGGNHPVKDLTSGRVYISSQNHGYVVDTEKLDEAIAVPAFINVNDGTNEGLSYQGKNIFTVQFHPEASPGPQDSAYLFDRFITMMGGNA